MTRCMRLTLSLVFLSLLAGCSTSEWVHPNRPKDQFTLDYNKCQAERQLDSDARPRLIREARGETNGAAMAKATSSCT